VKEPDIRRVQHEGTAEMRKVTAGLFSSIDGVVEAPDQWQPAFDDEMGATPACAVADPSHLVASDVPDHVLVSFPGRFAFCDVSFLSRRTSY
jgi:hypothetical protein